MGDKTVTRSGAGEDGPVAIVEVPSETNSFYSDQHLSDEYVDIDSQDEGKAVHTDRSNVSKTTGKRRIRRRKGAIDFTPPDKLLQSTEKRSRKYTENKQYDKAMRELIRCTALARIVYGDGHWKLARAFANLAEGYLELKGYAEQAKCHAEAASVTMGNTAQISHSSTERGNILEVLVKTHYTQGRALTLLKKHSEAEAAFSKAEREAKARSKLPTVTSDDAENWNIKIALGIAKLSARQHKFAMSVTYFEGAIDMIERKDGHESMDLVPVYQALAVVEQSKGKHADHEKAISYFQQAYSIAAANYKSTSVEVAEVAYGLANAYAATGEIDGETSAESYLNECLATYQAVYGPHHEKTLLIQDELANLMIRTDRQDEALTMLKSSYEAKQEFYGEFSAELAESHKLIASIELSKGNINKAVREFKKCLNIQTVVHGSNHKKTKDTQRTLDILLANPSVASKQPKTKAEELKERPRFNSIVNRSDPVGGFKTQSY